MPSWSLALAESPLNRVSGSGIVAQLTAATIASGVTFDLADSGKLTFTMPVRHYQTPLIVPFASDVLLYRQGDQPGATPKLVQRFRVVGRTIPISATGQVTFSCATYREVLRARMLHDGDHLDFPTSGSGTMEQSAIGWALIQQEQAKPQGNLGISQGVTPATAVQRSAYVTDVSSNTTPQHFFSVGAYIADEIQSKLASLVDGFEWDVEPDPAAPETGLVYNAWNVGGRGQVSQLVLSEATMSPDASMSEVATDYANVWRQEGGSSTVDGTTLPGVVVYVPSSGNPVPEAVPTGRWERSDSSTDLQTTAEVTAYAQKQAELAQEVETWTVPLMPGVWQGPEQLWLGDTVALKVEIVTTYDDGSPAGTLLSVDEELRVLGITVSPSSSGAESVSLTLNHPKTKFADGPIPSQLGRRLARLERRS